MVYLQQTLLSYLVTGLLIHKHQVGYQYSFYYGVPTTDSTFLPIVTGLLIHKHQVGYQYSFYYGVLTTDSTFLPSNRPLNS